MTPKRNIRRNNGGAARSYISKERVELIQAQLIERQRELLFEVAHLRLMSGQQLRRMYYRDTEAGRRLARLDLARLTEWRVLARLDRRIGGVRAGSDGYLYSLDVVGQRIVHPGVRRYRTPHTPGEQFVAHGLAVSELYVELRERSGDQSLQLMRFDVEPWCWRRFSGPGGRQFVLKPDAFAMVVSGEYEDRYFLEVDRATESPARIIDKAMQYARYWQSGREQEAHGIYPRVLWITPDDRRHNQVVEALGTFDPEQWQLFATTTADRAADRIAGTEAAR